MDVAWLIAAAAGGALLGGAAGWGIARRAYGWRTKEWERRLDETGVEARTDGLTGAGNRRALEECLRHQHALVKRYAAPCSVVMLDVDHFKQTNDRFGHLAGDEVLVRLARLFRRNARESDLLFRYGGDEFVLVLPQTDDQGGAILADRIRREVEGTADWGTGEIIVRVSAGIAPLSSQNEWQTTLDRADEALRRAKTLGRNRVCRHELPAAVQ